MYVRTANVDELDALAHVWHDAWRDAHAELVDEAFARSRTVESFRERLPDLLPDLRTVGDPNKPLGLAVIRDDELYQLFVARDARGTGVAKLLIEDAEKRLAANGVRTAWLACAVGNDRAARFYEKSGWHLARTYVAEIPIDDRSFNLDVWRYEKTLRPE